MKDENKKQKKDYSSFILIVVFFIGLSVLLYPSVSDYWNSRTQSRAIVDYESHLQTLSDEEYFDYFAAADEYNAKIKEIEFPFMYYDKVEGYEDILDVSGTGIMGYINIEKIDVGLPIYHGTSAGVLNIAVGHVQGSSLPAGGPGTHIVLSAHRGLPSAKLFSNLDKLQEGDIFTINVLNRVLCYEIDQILIVKPEEVDEIYVKEGEDLCTLVTCTPYGINTHRILARGHRIENPEDMSEIRVSADAVQIEAVLVAPVVAAPMLLALLVILLFKSRKRK